MEKLHPFDTKKWGRVVARLIKEKLLTSVQDVYKAPEISTDTLERVHTKEYLDSLESAMTLAQITEVGIMNGIFFNFLRDISCLLYTSDAADD